MALLNAVYHFVACANAAAPWAFANGYSRRCASHLPRSHATYPSDFKRQRNRYPFFVVFFLSAQRVTFPLTEQRNNCMHILQQQTQVRGKRPSTQSSLIGRSWLIFPRCILSLLKAVLALTRGTSSDLIKAPEVGSHPKY